MNANNLNHRAANRTPCCQPFITMTGLTSQPYALTGRFNKAGGPPFFPIRVHSRLNTNSERS